MEDGVKEKKTEDKRCFVMMPISDQGDYPQGHFTKVYEQIFQPAIREAGFEPYRVDENKISDSIISKIFDAILSCPIALCDLSNRNPNVLYELGLRQAYDKPVVLVQDEKTERIFDVSGINTVSYSSIRLYENVMKARERITEAIISTCEGKENSIVKVMKAGAAEYSSMDISKEDKITIMLNSMMRDIQSLKESNSSEDGIKDRIFDYKAMKLPKEKEIYIIELRHGITNREINAVIGEMKERYSILQINIRHKRSGNELWVDIHGGACSWRIKQDIFDQLKDRLT